GQRSVGGGVGGSILARVTISSRSLSASAHSVQITRWASISRRSAGESPPSRYSERESFALCLMIRSASRSSRLSSVQVLPQEHPRTVELRLRRSRGNAQELRDLLVLEALDIVEHEDGPGAFGKPRDRILEVHPEIRASVSRGGEL